MSAIDTGAVFSPCMRYRTKLWRIWDASKPLVLFLLLNPSTADEVRNDPTVERCQRRAMMMGFGGLMVANIFALRSTDPAALSQVEDPVGPGNDEAIVECAARAQLVVCGWGTHGSILDRGDAVLELLRQHRFVPHALQRNADGSPKHPLYVGYKHAPSPMQA